MLATYYGIKKLVRVIENSSTTFSPEFCGINHVGTAVEAFAVREWSGDLDLWRHLTLNENLCYGLFISMFIVYLLNHCAMGFLQKIYNKE